MSTCAIVIVMQLCSDRPASSFPQRLFASISADKRLALVGSTALEPDHSLPPARAVLRREDAIPNIASGEKMPSAVLQVMV